MEKGICLVACLPLRKEANEKSEMVSQIIFGEEYDILSKEGSFFRVELLHDQYQGYISKESVVIQNNNIKTPQDFSYLASVYTRIKDHRNNCMLIIPAGSALPLGQKQKDSFQLNGQKFSVDTAPDINSKNNISDLATLFLGSPYLWGGRTFMGIDCSGLVQTVFKMKGLNVPRDASQQIELGKRISIEDSSKGDIAYFQNNAGKITHVGILDGNGHIIHSSGKVKTEKITHEGIINAETGKISHILHSIKRI